jgi:hypothetical protein
MMYHEYWENSTEPIRSSTQSRMSVRRYSNLCATKAKPRLGGDPKFRNGPALEDAEEKIENPKHAHKAHDYLETTDMPAKDGYAKEKGSNGEFYKRCG